MAEQGMATVVAPATVIHGEIHCAGDLVVQGRVEGSIRCGGALRLEPGATIEADVRARSAELAGRVRGDVHVEGVAVLTESCRLIGDLHAAEIRIAPGAAIRGRVALGILEEEGEAAGPGAISSPPGADPEPLPPAGPVLASPAGSLSPPVGPVVLPQAEARAASRAAIPAAVATAGGSAEAGCLASSAPTSLAPTTDAPGATAGGATEAAAADAGPPAGGADGSGGAPPAPVAEAGSAQAAGAIESQAAPGAGAPGVGSSPDGTAAEQGDGAVAPAPTAEAPAARPVGAPPPLPPSALALGVRSAVVLKG